MRFLKTNTATRITVGPFFDKTDGITPETSLTVTSCKLTLMVDDGGVPTLVIDAAPTASGGDNDMVHVTNDDAGFYGLELTAAQLNYVGRAMLAITDAATHCPVFHEFMILPAKVFDSLVGGTDNLEVDTVQWLGTACATPTVAGVPEVDMTHMAGGTQTVTDLKDFADSGYDPAEHKVQGVVLTDTLTTYTGNTPQTGDSYARLGAPAGASVSADIAAIFAKNSGVKKNTALGNFEFFMRDSTDHITGKTGLTVTAERSIDGGAFGACANAASEVGVGVYKISLAAADLNGDVITLKFTGTGADATLVTIKTES
jgi:hypothetical protein